MRNIPRMNSDQDSNGEDFYDFVIRKGKARGLKSAQAICKAAGLDKDFLRKIRDGENKRPDAHKIAKLANALAMSAEGLLSLSEDGQRAGDEAATREPSANTLEIEELDVRTSAGPGALRDHDGAERVVETWSLPTQLIRSQTSATEQDLKIIPVYGDSMAPDFLPGERLLVDVGHQVPSPPGVYVVWDGFGIVIKRLELVPNSSPQLVRLIPRNQQYAIYELPLADVHIRARVIGKWQWT